MIITLIDHVDNSVCLSESACLLFHFTLKVFMLFMLPSVL